MSGYPTNNRTHTGSRGHHQDSERGRIRGYRTNSPRSSETSRRRSQSDQSTGQHRRRDQGAEGYGGTHQSAGRRNQRGGYARGGRRNRGGEAQRSNRGYSRPNFREERFQALRNEPAIPDDIDWKDLDPSVRQDLRSLSKDNAERVGRHMVAAVQFLANDDPIRALKHARAAKERGGRVAVVRETLGATAYHAGEWKEALSELRAARRMSGSFSMVAVMADCERGLGRPEKAIEMAHDESLEGLSRSEQAELAIVVSGARRDMGEYEAAVLELERFGLEDIEPMFAAARVHYAYADALIDVGRKEEAREWFERSLHEDVDDVLDVGQRLSELFSHNDEISSSRDENPAVDPEV